MTNPLFREFIALVSAHFRRLVSVPVLRGILTVIGDFLGELFYIDQ
ncbi:MAG: hypothetical protein ACI8P0_000631 [Planctomycetaceae bacterium]|jgi:hypothetical protein